MRSGGHGETTLVVDAARIVEACTYLRDELAFNFLSDLTPTDYLGWGEQQVAGYLGTAAGRDINQPGTNGLARRPAAKPKRFSLSYHLLALRPGAPRVRRQISRRCYGGPLCGASRLARREGSLEHPSRDLRS